jgi:hypothetical protein
MSYRKEVAFALALVAGLCGSAWAQGWGNRDGDQTRNSRSWSGISRTWHENSQTRAQNRDWARNRDSVYRNGGWTTAQRTGGWGTTTPTTTTTYPYPTQRPGGWGTVTNNGTYYPNPLSRTGGWGTAYPNGTYYPYPTYPYPNGRYGWGYPNGTPYPTTSGYPYPGTGGWGGYGGPGGYGGYGGGNAAYQTGYMDGVNAGRIDRRMGAYRGGSGGLYKHADHGYNHGYGSKGAYQQAYREGYLAGYRRGFGRV